MYYLIMYNGQSISIDNNYLGHTQSINVIRWFSQHIKDIEVFEYKSFDDMWKDMKENGLAGEINPFYTAEYELNYVDGKQFEYPPIVIDDDYADDVAVDEFMSSIEMLEAYKELFVRYVTDDASGVKNAIINAIEMLVNMNEDIKHHRLTDEASINFDTQVVVAWWILKDEYYTYYLGEY